MAWYLTYHGDTDLLHVFETEQEYVDAMFVLLIWQNFGVLLRTDSLLTR